MRNKIIGIEVYGKVTFKSITPMLGGCSIKHEVSTSLCSLLLVAAWSSKRTAREIALSVIELVVLSLHKLKESVANRVWGDNRSRP